MLIYDNTIADRVQLLIIVCVKDIILTNMVMIIRGDEVLCLDRQKNDWPGLTFPGGKVEDDEDIASSAIREVKEETGLTIDYPFLVGYVEWDIDDERHLCMLFRADDFTGELRSSKEGRVYFLPIKELHSQKLSTDMDIILDKYGLEWRRDDKG